MKKYNILDAQALIDQNCDPERVELLTKTINHPSLSGRYQLAPASSRVSNHEAYPGGLLDHSIRVAKVGLALAGGYNGLPGDDPKVQKVSAQAIVTVALLHDLNKIGDTNGQTLYNPNILKSGKVSDAIPYQKSKDIFPPVGGVEGFLRREFGLKYDDGQLSLAIINHYVPEMYQALTDFERFAILYHDGGWGSRRYNNSDQESALEMIIHCADMLASRESKF